jgi:hypothetical protein
LKLIPMNLARRHVSKHLCVRYPKQNKADRMSGTDEGQITEKKTTTRNTKDYTRNLPIGDAVESIAKVVTSNTGKMQIWLHMPIPCALTRGLY